jgi:hypothetical protein
MIWKSEKRTVRTSHSEALVQVRLEPMLVFSIESTQLLESMSDPVPRKLVGHLARPINPVVCRLVSTNLCHWYVQKPCKLYELSRNMAHSNCAVMRWSLRIPGFDEALGAQREAVVAVSIADA